MPNQHQTVKELRAIAKERNIARYYKMRRDELLEALGMPEEVPSASSGSGGTTHILDEPVPEIGVPILGPTKYVPPSAPSRLWRKRVSEYNKRVQKKINKFANWILNYVPKRIKKPANERIRKLKEEVRSIWAVLEPFSVKEKERALKGFFKTYRIDGKKGYGPKEFIKKIKPKVLELLYTRSKPIKVKFVFTCTFIKENLATGKIEETEGYFHTELEIVTDSTDLSKLFDAMTELQLEKVAKFEGEQSGWQFDRVEYFDIHINPFEPISGTSYIPLPKVLADKKAIINVKNENDDECFKWAVTSAVFPKENHGERLNAEIRENSKKFDWTGMEFPVTLRDITKFEKQNPYAINVYGYESGVNVLRISKRREVTVINLLLLHKDEMNHYCWIKNLSRLLSSQVDKHDGRKYFCHRCLNPFNTQSSLDKHLEFCSNHQAVKMTVPINEDGSPQFFGFKNRNRKMEVPFVVYADFECYTEKIYTCYQDEGRSFTNRYQKHKPSGFCYLIKCFDNAIFEPKLVRHTAESPYEDVPKMFMESLESDIKQIYDRFKLPKNPHVSEDERIDYVNATHCHICGSMLGHDKVLDHCHLTGKYRGAAHEECNLNYKVPKFVPVIFHNLSGYDGHLFVRNIGESKGKLDCIPINDEKYISFTKEIVVDSYKNKKGKTVEIKRVIRFIDSFRFMAAGLGRLVDNLPQSSLVDVTSWFERVMEDGTDLQLLTRKGVFPYDWFDGFDKLSETHLPPKDEFYSKLYDAEISDEDYQHAQNVWKVFGIESFREYHDLYLELDVLLLADVFENFRDVCRKNYDLDPAWYYTAPGLAWDAALKMTNVRLELLNDPDMLLMIEKGIRGGISMISTRYSKANNPYMKDYDPSLSTKYITYLDANGLYGCAMGKPLPTHDFRWLTEEELVLKWKDMPCILEVDMRYQKHLHKLHNDYPLAPERVTVNGVDKLIPNLSHKRKYIIHHETLKQYLSLGLKVYNIHRGITFKESAWLKPYIDLNTELRTKATNDFEKDFFKLMNNSVFGKTMENVRNRVDVRLVTDESKAKKLVSKPNYHHRTIFCENLVAVQMKKTKLVLDKPIYLGFSVLELSKTIMYDFHYNYIKPKYGGKAKLLFTGTDSLAYEVETDDFYKDISPDVRDRFDTSNYPEDHPSGIEVGVNKKVGGMFKDEAGGKQIIEFVGLRAKLYSYMMDEGKEEKKCKGVKKAVVKKSISFNDYKDCLFNQKSQRRTMNIIRSHLHDVYTETVNKVALSCEDDKRVVREDGIHTYAYGHFRTLISVKT